MNYNDDSERLCAEMTQILRQHKEVPSDFIATVAVKADPDAVKMLAKQLYSREESNVCCAAPPFHWQF